MNRDEVTNAVDRLIKDAGLDDECRDRVTDLIVAAFQRKRKNKEAGKAS